MSRRLLLAIFALEVALAVAIGAYSLEPTQLAPVGKLVHMAFGALPMLLLGGTLTILLGVIFHGRSTRDAPVITEEARTLLELKHQVELHPSAYNLFQLARFCEKTSRYAMAAGVYARVLELEPERLQARYGYGISLFRTGRIEAAIDELERVFANDPAHDYGQIEVRLAEAYLRNNRPDRALATLDAHRSCQGTAEFHFLRGQALEKLGFPAEARSQHLLVLEAAAASPAHRKEKDRHLAQLARQFLVRRADQSSSP